MKNKKRGLDLHQSAQILGSLIGEFSTSVDRFFG